MPKLESLKDGRARVLRIAAALAFVAPLLTRLVIGQAYYQTGGGKIENFAGTAAFFGELGIPFPEVNAFVVSRLEFWGGLLLVAGLATRLVAAGLASTMVVALATADRESFLGALRGTSESGLTDVAAFVYLLFLLWLVLFGPGPASLDAVVVRWLHGKAPATPAPAA